jgi:hypothetical protein
MMTIKTLDDVRDYFTWLKTQPLPTGPHESEANLMPILEAFKDWGDEEMAELFVQLGLTLAVKRGDKGKEMLGDATVMIGETLIRREYLKGHVN